MQERSVFVGLQIRLQRKQILNAISNLQMHFFLYRFYSLRKYETLQISWTLHSNAHTIQEMGESGI